MRAFYFSLLIVSLVTCRDLKGRYIVLLEEEEERGTFETMAMHIEALMDDRSGSGSEVTSRLPLINALGGIFSNSMLEILRMDPMVEEVVPITKKWAFKIQKNSTWGLSRISRKKREIPATNIYKYKESPNGEGVRVYVIDSGISINHEDFEGRASFGTATIQESSNEDHFGHGTHCAGIIAGKTFGVAKKAEVVAVKVLDDEGFGDDESVIKGIQWAVKDSKTRGKRAVLSMSLGGDKSSAVDRAVESAFKSGLIIVAAAGNDNSDACNVSPANTESAITVGSIDTESNKSSFSNYGKCVKILAPGTNIESTWIESNDSTLIANGTSMAAPYVSGQVAVLWSEFDPEIDSKNHVIDKLYSMALKNQTTGWDKDTRNWLLYNGQ